MKQLATALALASGAVLLLAACDSGEQASAVAFDQVAGVANDPTAFAETFEAIKNKSVVWPACVVDMVTEANAEGAPATYVLLDAKQVGETCDVSETPNVKATLDNEVLAEVKPGQVVTATLVPRDASIDTGLVLVAEVRDIAPRDAALPTATDAIDGGAGTGTSQPQ